MQNTKRAAHLWEEEGVPLLEAILLRDLPSEVHPQIQAYYDALWQALLEETEKRLLPALVRAYREDTHPRKRFCHGRGRLVLSLVGEEADGYLSIKRRLSYVQKGEERTVTHGEVFSTESGRLLPLSHFCPRHPRPLRGKRRTRALREAIRRQDYVVRGGVAHLVTVAEEMPLKGRANAPRS